MSTDQRTTTIRQTRRSLLRGTTALLSASLLAACGPLRPAAPQAGPATASYWFWADLRVAWLKRALDDYNRERHQLTVNWEQASPDAGGLVEKTVVAAAAGTPPDGVEVHINWFSKFIVSADPLLAPMNDRLKGRERDLFGPSGYEPWAWQGKIYGLGNELNAATLAYRKDLFDQAGITVPVRTYQDYADAGRRIKALGGDKRISDIANIDVLRLMLQRGGGWFDDRGQPAINSPANAEVLTWIRDATVRADVLATPLTRPGFNVFEQINQGNLASRIVAPAWWFGGSLPTNAPGNKGLWRLTAMPQWGGRGPRTTTAGGTGAAALRTARARDSLMDFLIFAHTTPAILHDFDVRNNWPTYRKVIDERRLQQPSEFLGGQAPGQLLKEVAGEIPHWRTSPWLLEVDNEVNRLAITPVLRGEKEVQRALDEAQEAAKAYIATQTGRR